MSIIQAAGSGEVSTGFYNHTLDQSIRFHTADSQYLTRKITSAGDRQKATFSFWIKQNSLDASTVAHVLYDQGDNNGTNHFYMLLYQDNLYINDYDYGSSGSPGSDILFQTTRKFRDTASWTNIVVRMDTTQSTEADRVRIYINGGDPETAFTGSTTYPSHNANLHILNQTTNSTSVDTSNVRIGYHNSHYSDCYMAEYNYCDGQSLGPDSFGETKDGIWIPKDTSGLTFGTNGFHLTFKDDAISEGFNTVTYTGTGAAQSVSGVGFDPDFLWFKSRSNADPHELIDTLRGATKRLRLNSTNAESTASSGDGFASFDADGFTLNSDGGGGQVNGSGRTYAAWAWEAGGAPTATNSAGAGATPTAGSVKIDGSNLGSALAGSIAATKLSANTARGFSMVTYTGTGSNATVAHGLSSAPKMYWVRGLSGGGDFKVYAEETGNTTQGFLNDPAAFAGSATTLWNSTSPTSTVFSIGTNSNVNTSSATYIAYCFTDVTGYCKIGSYTGNASSSGPTVSLGFEPAWLLIKNTEASENWYIWDNTREPAPAQKNARLHPNLAVVEQTSTGRSITFSSSGFQVTGSDSSVNGSSQKHLYMAFADTREAAFFKDVSGQGNHFTPVNLDYRHSVPDTPTNNFCTFNEAAIDSSVGSTLVKGNLGVSIAASGGAETVVASFTLPRTGKWYWEYRTGQGGSSIYGRPAILLASDYYTQSANVGEIDGGSAASNPNGVLFVANTGQKRINDSDTSFGNAVSAGDIVGLAYNADTGQLYIYINNSIQASGAAISESIKGNLAGKDVFILHQRYNGNGVDVYNFGQDSSFAGLVATANSNADENGFGSFAYSPPSGYVALCSQNLPDPAITDGASNFNTVTYTGTGSSNSVTGVGFQPDWVWGKRRDSTGNHWLNDAVRGATKGLHSDSTNAEYTDATVMNAFNSDGFTVVSHAISNASSATYVAWNWLASTAFSNDASATGVGTIDSEGRTNATAGFSIIKWAGTGSNGTIAHGLSAAPELIIAKNRDATDEWPVLEMAYNGATHYLRLNSTAVATSTSVMWNNTAPTSSVFSVGTYEYVNASGENYIAYCFHSVEGYSKIAYYTGNGNADGPFVHTGFRPAWIMIKDTGSTNGWQIHDSKRPGYNPAEKTVDANTTAAEANSNDLDILSNGFKVRNTYGTANQSTSVYVYIALADQPFKFSNSE